MRVLIIVFVVFSLLLNGGCAIYEKETSNRGGYLDAVLDDHWMRADSKGMRALRAFRHPGFVGAHRIRFGKERVRPTVTRHSHRSPYKALPANLCLRIRHQSAWGAGGKNDPCFYYDSAMVDYSTGLFDLAMIALPVEDAGRARHHGDGKFRQSDQYCRPAGFAAADWKGRPEVRSRRWSALQGYG